MVTPTAEIYGALEQAFRHFNTDLFGGQLPAALITLQRKGARTLGYFSPKRFKGRESERTTDEIAMNPQHFLRPLPETLSTLVHEMCHLWQDHFDRTSRSGYHNKSWAVKMVEIGLQPTVSGEPGGKQTGQKMMHFVIGGGKFEKSCRRLLESRFDLVWAEALNEAADPEGNAPEEDEDKGRVRCICPRCKQKADRKSVV
jgi:hypothetical protein